MLLSVFQDKSVQKGKEKNSENLSPSLAFCLPPEGELVSKQKGNVYRL